MNRFEVVCEVGGGVTSTVYLARDIATGERVALKRMRKDQVVGCSFDREVAVQKFVHKHNNIVTVLDTFETDTHYFIVQEFIEGGDLAALILEECTTDGRIRPARSPRVDPFNVFADLVDAVAFLHSHDIVHLDIKPENVLLTKNGEAVLSDFGHAVSLSIQFEKDGCTGCYAGHARGHGSGGILHGTKSYQAPEVLELRKNGTGFPANYKALDVWALGIVLFILLCGHFPWDEAINDDSNQAYKQYVATGELEQWKTLPTDVVFLLKAMLCIDPRFRFTISDVRNFIGRKWGLHYVSPVVRQARPRVRRSTLPKGQSLFQRAGERGSSRCWSLLSYALFLLVLGVVFLLGAKCAPSLPGFMGFYVTVNKAGKTLLGRSQ
eukprot:comp18310_c0_seq1/m.19369 comp18310_c0_seq1/g.19369  ORF comp18310_c0_seq1/g.19369 comp18310_c0_seq1/m.19369 type:complete len:380 (-) comp18310_c0_seq1:445-1584(-)